MIPSSKPIKLMQVFNQYLEHGGEEVWVNTISGFSNKSLSVRDLRFQSKEWTGRGAPTLLRQARKVWNNPESRDRMRAAAENIRPDVLLFHNLIPVGSLGLYDEARKLNLPVVQYIHNFRPFSASGTMWVNGKVNPAGLRGNPWPEVFGRAWEKSFLKTLILASYQSKLILSGGFDVIRRWIAVSEFMRDRFVEAGIAPDKVTTLRHCWHPQATSEPDKMSGHYLFLGRLVAEKGIYTLLKAWAILEKRLGKACPRLVIAGSGPAEAKVHAMVNRMRMVVCVGFVSGKKKSDLLQGCRALIAPSIWWEPLGLIVYEAYDYRRPVLVSKSGGLKETVVEGETGYLHDVGDANALANDVERMEQQGVAGRLAMGENGHKWLLKNASPQDWLNQFTSIISEVRDQQ